MGDYVKLRSGGATGLVESIDRNRAMVQIGEMRMVIKLRDLQLAKEPLSVQSSKGVRHDVATSSTGFQSKIDIRGMRFDEALKIVEDFIDQALLTNTPYLRIL
ncbi:MutS2/Smr-associated SH3 domain-containing protein, partial [Arthrospira platensis SPKY1]|nr:MutS2/Smr-associated SH3 domain-containing protein [Arthrospira platensis SPKY1]